MAPMMSRRNQLRRAIQRRERASNGAVVILGTASVLTLIVSFFYDEMGFPKYLTMKHHAQQLEEEIQELDRANSDLRIEVQRVQTDPLRIEQLARENLGFVRHGEKVFQIVEEPSPSGLPR